LTQPDEPTAITLPDGEVLLTHQGGAAELYNPSTGAWQATGSMTISRYGYTATLLPDGEVLVAGGEAAGAALASAELYNPSTGTWQLTGSMAFPRQWPSAALLPDGDVLVAGGESGTAAMASAELYDPSTGIWQTTGSMSAVGFDETMMALGNGTALVFGGTNTGDEGTTPPAEIYNPATQSWQDTGNLLYPYNPADNGATATLLPDGGVLVAGGELPNPPGDFYAPTPSTTDAEIYEPASGTWQAAASMNVPRSNAAAVVLGDGTVLMTGGSTVGGYEGDQGTYVPPEATATTEIYNAGSNTWTLGPDMNVARYQHVAAVLSNGTVLAAGGIGSSDTFLTSAEIYNPAATPPPAAPVVTGISPSSGPAAGGTAVTVTGSNLSGGSVAFGGTAATGVSCSASSCTATSPAGTGMVGVTVTTSAGTSATSTADDFTYQAATTSSNLVPDPGFESAGVPSDYWGSRLARSTAVVHSGSWALAQTTTSSSGGWDLDSNANWYAPISSGESYTAGIWVRSAAAVKVDLNLDLLDSGGNYVDSANGPTVTLAANTWTHLTITGIEPVAGEVYGGMEPDFSGAAGGTVVYWDDMSLTSP
jgi:hypothetical protein